MAPLRPAAVQDPRPAALRGIFFKASPHRITLVSLVEGTGHREYTHFSNYAYSSRRNAACVWSPCCVLWWCNGGLALGPPVCLDLGRSNGGRSGRSPPRARTMSCATLLVRNRRAPRCSQSSSVREPEWWRLNTMNCALEEAQTQLDSTRGKEIADV